MNSDNIDKKAAQITEGLYRWIINTVNQAIEVSKDGLKQPILGPGTAPLSPMEAREQIKQLHIDHLTKMRDQFAVWLMAPEDVDQMKISEVVSYFDKEIATLTKKEI